MNKTNKTNKTNKINNNKEVAYAWFRVIGAFFTIIYYYWQYIEAKRNEQRRNTIQMLKNYLDAAIIAVVKDIEEKRDDEHEVGVEVFTCNYRGRSSFRYLLYE